MSEKIMVKQKMSFKMQNLAAAAAIVGAVVLPQLLHLIGIFSGMGTALGETFLPMHLPVILVGFMAGTYAGAVSGFLAPLVSFALSGMPGTALLPFMMIELCVYGAAAGLLRKVNMPIFGKVVLVQIAGRGIRAMAILLGIRLFGSVIPAAIIWTSIRAGLLGIILQWILIPLIIFRVEQADKNRE